MVSAFFFKALINTKYVTKYTLIQCSKALSQKLMFNTIINTSVRPVMSATILRVSHFSFSSLHVHHSRICYLEVPQVKHLQQLLFTTTTTTTYSRTAPVALHSSLEQRTIVSSITQV